jgi:hypothetical protein
MKAKGDEFSVHGTSKIDFYGWELKDKPGKLAWIDKRLLFVDHAYQRNAANKRVINYASNWSWIACGVLVVAKRKDEDKFYVVEGQHRMLAARKRVDIQELPCIVFETDGPKEEAAGFYDANTGRRMPTSLEKWKALLMLGDTTVAFVDSLITQSGRVASNVAGPKDVRCLTAMIKAAQSNKDVMKRIWPIVFSGLFWIESNLPQEQSLSDKKWRERVLKVGYQGLLESARRAATFYTKGGPKVWGIGQLEAMNKGCRIHIELRDAEG